MSIETAGGSGESIATNLGRGRIPSLDGLRALAIILVLFAHARQTRGFPDNSLIRQIYVHGAGAVGVELFFVISGFLITVLMLRETERDGQVNIRQFYLRRSLRILPAYLVFLLAVLLISISEHAPLSRRDWLAASTYSVNFLLHPAWNIGHVWSLSIEEHFYLFWPLVLAAGGIIWARYFAIFCIVTCFLLRCIILVAYPRWTQMAELWTFTRLDTIAFGCLLAVLYWDPPWQRRLDRLCESNGLLVAMALAIGVSALILSRSVRYTVGVSFTLDAACITMLLAAAIRRPDSIVGHVLNSRVLAPIGIGSYSLYLWQQVFLNPTSRNWPSGFPQNIFLAIIAAACCHYLVERPFLRLKDRLRPKAIQPADSRVASK